MNKIIKRLPYGVRSFGKYILELPARTRRKWDYFFAEKIPKEEIVNKLRSLGGKGGSTLFVHSSLERLGFVRGEANTVIDAILEVLGPDGTLVIPVFSWFPPVLRDYVTDKPPVFDCKRSPSGLGKISETFRRRPGVLRSCHPTHSVCAYGPQAKFLVSEHINSKTPFDAFSPYQKLLALNADILCLGVSTQFITFYHVYEDLNPHFPLKVYSDKPIRIGINDAKGKYQIITTYCHREDLAKTRIDHDRRVARRVKKYFQKEGILKEIKVGERWSYLLNTNEVVKTLDAMLKEGQTIYAG
ncbi:MAG: AAC(3) family N-acetyltransferase [Candidatus Saganbacteria bacterium]|nr:AAC(3) family N-acetyltransferase [Candidatus Saganbacteria bacterium]